MTQAPSSPDRDTAGFDELGLILNRVIDRAEDPRQASNLIDEVSELLWLVTSLDPEAEKLLLNSQYVTDLIAAPR